MLEPATPAMLLMPRAIPRWSVGKASVMIALEFASSMAPPTPWPTRMTISHSAPLVPVIHVTVNSTEKTVKTRKPRL
jgi:hypothetical protein